MKKILILAILLLATASLSADDQLSMDEFIKKPTGEIKQLHSTNLTKGQELYNLKQYKESLPYLDKAIFFSNVLIKQAEMRKKAEDLLKEAKKWVKDAGTLVDQNKTVNQ